VTRHPHLVALVAAAALFVVVVGSPQALSVLQDKHLDGRWTLVKAPAPVPPGLRITISEGHLTGSGICNDFGSGWSQDDGPTKDFTSTVVGCGSGQDAMENAYFDLLTSTTSTHLDDGQLVLSGPGGRLVYDRRD
jgi:heat shock protein HslJ